MVVTARQRGSTGVPAVSELATWAVESASPWPNFPAEAMAAFPVSCFPDPESCAAWTTLGLWTRRTTTWTLLTSCPTVTTSSG